MVVVVFPGAAHAHNVIDVTSEYKRRDGQSPAVLFLRFPPAVPAEPRRLRCRTVHIDNPRNAPTNSVVSIRRANSITVRIFDNVVAEIVLKYVRRARRV